MPGHDALIFTPDDVDLTRSPLRRGIAEPTYVLGAFNPGMTRLPNGNLLLMVRIAEALREPVVGGAETGNARAIRWTPAGYVLDAHPLVGVDMTDPRQFALKGHAYRVLALTSLSWLLPVELTPDGTAVVAVHYDRAIEPAASYQDYGIEDARISRIGDTWYMTTCSVSAERHSTTLYTSTNGLDYEPRGMILDHQNKDMLLFEGLVGGAFTALTRPLGECYFAYPEDSPWIGGPSINLATSPDAFHWRPLPSPGIRARKGSSSAMKVGGGTPPILTDAGWLTLYHGVERRETVGIYRSFWALLDRDDPGTILRLEDRTPLLEADPALTAPIAHQLYLPTPVVFSTGLVDGGDRYIVASGEADLACRITHLGKEVFGWRVTPGCSAPWWQSGVIYQVYPRSFKDSDGDGVGDLNGVAARLDYLADLGVDAVWLSPIFPSPMADFGYDVADYTGVDPLFGSLADFDALLAAAHARGLKLLLDFVPNHSSDRHPWFAESRVSRDAAKRDWYVWRDPAADGGPPNNWQSFFGGPAWTYDEATGQYYLHQFLKEQPDLNWRNPDLVEAMLAALRFWFDRGVDGFRIDVLWLLLEDEGFRDNPPNPVWRPGMQDIDRLLPLHTADQPGMAALTARMRAVADEYDDRVLVGEIYLPLDRLVAYYGEAGEGVHLPFNFALLQTPWEAGAIAGLIGEYEALLPAGGWPNWVLGNHDKPRIAARLGLDQARVAQMLLLTLRGTPTLYQGDEIGLTGEPIATDRIRDPQALREPDTAFNRDEVRMPMAWDASPHAGFSTAEPWLPLNRDWPTRNVAAQRSEPDSMLRLVRRLLALRREHPALAVGDIAAVAAVGDVLTFERHLGEERIVVALNLGAGERAIDLPPGDVLLTTGGGYVPGRLAPDQGVILRA